MTFYDLNGIIDKFCQQNNMAYLNELLIFGTGKRTQHAPRLQGSNWVKRQGLIKTDVAYYRKCQLAVKSSRKAHALTEESIDQRSQLVGRN